MQQQAGIFSFAAIVTDNAPAESFLLTELHAIACDDPALAIVLEDMSVQALLIHIGRYSPYLSGLVLRHHTLVSALNNEHVDHLAERLTKELTVRATGLDPAALMPVLRLAKQKLSLLAALADIGGLWPVTRVTEVLSAFAEQSLEIAFDALVMEGIRKGALNEVSPRDCGAFILGMGKLGGRELNYSSDIDLIVLFDPEKLPYIGRQSAQHFMNRLTQDLLSVMQDRTSDGYVFRTDLRLRPDPGSTPPAMTVRAAINYYESVGQNWERAAMIKARLVAGDREAGAGYQRALQPFIWRKHLDFAAIADILSIKRQMHGKSGGPITLPGHNIKTGRGGIREIEFLAQIYQLIWGGRYPELRTQPTIPTLRALVEAEIIPAEKADMLIDIYHFLRMIEHRLQMVADQQTHSLPESEQELNNFACFAGYKNLSGFSRSLLAKLEKVHAIYNETFQNSAPLGDAEGRLVFTGVDADTETLETLRSMGFNNPAVISAAVQDWHKGNRRCTRTQRARELLTELMPELLTALGKTVNPDNAFHRFDEFLARLPGGVQIFSLFHSNRELLRLIANVFGSAPHLGKQLSLNPHLLDAVLTGSFYADLPDMETLREDLGQSMEMSENEEDRLQRLQIFKNEKEFQVGIQLLDRMVSVTEAGDVLTNLSELLVGHLAGIVSASFAEQYGTFPGGSLVVLALGKLGSRELTLDSDLDLIFLYDLPEDSITSDGPKPLDPSAYFNRLAQRIIGTLTARTRNGRLYDIDTRLRPFGKDGPLAVSISSLEKYLLESAWLVEKLAYTRVRAIFGDAPARAHALAMLARCLAYPPDAAQLAHALCDLRRKVTEQYPTSDPWNIKYVSGGLMDADFVLQYLLVRHGDTIYREGMPEYLEAFKRLAATSEANTEWLNCFAADRDLLTRLLTYIRLCFHERVDEQKTPEAIRTLLADVCDKPDFESLKQHVILTEARIAGHMNTLEQLLLSGL